jgi:hypothetical protein
VAGNTLGWSSSTSRSGRHAGGHQKAAGVSVECPRDGSPRERGCFQATWLMFLQNGRVKVGMGGGALLHTIFFLSVHSYLCAQFSFRQPPLLKSCQLGRVDRRKLS